MFRNSTNLLLKQEAIKKNKSYNWNTKSVTNMSYMFKDSLGFRNRKSNGFLDVDLINLKVSM